MPTRHGNRVPLLFALFVLVTSSASAQVDPGPCDTCYKHYAYDSALYIGFHQMQEIGFHDTLLDGMGFTQDYTLALDEPSEVFATVTWDTAIAWREDSTHPWGGFWDDTTMGTGTSADEHTLVEFERVRLWRQRRRYKEMMERGVGLMGHPKPLGDLSSASSVKTNYLISPPTFQPFYFVRYPFKYRPGIDTLNDDELRDNLTPVEGGFYWTLTVSGSATPSDSLIVGDPGYIAEVFPDAKGGAQPSYDAIWRIWHDDNGNLRPQAVADSLAALYDKRKWYGTGFAFHTSENLQQREDIPESAVLARADLFIRDTRDQTVCKCRIGRPWLSFSVTKKMYLDALEKARDDNDERFVAHKNGSDEPEDFFYQFDTLLDFASVMSYVNDSFGNPTEEKDTVTWTIAPGVTKRIPAWEWCDSLLVRRKGLPTSDPSYLAASAHKTANDFAPDYYTTRVVPVSFFQSRTAKHLYYAIENGDADSVIYATIDKIYTDTITRKIITRIGLGDEPQNHTVPGYRLLAGKVQRAMDQHPIAKDDPKPLWVNPPGNLDAMRLLSGDFDSIAYRQVHIPVRQDYQIGWPLPIMYGNPDSVGREAWDTVFEARLRTNTPTFKQHTIAGNSTEDYDRYYDKVMFKLFDPFKDHETISNDGGIIAQTAQLVDVFRFRYRERFPNIPSSPVWNVVRTHGSFDDDNNFTEFGAMEVPRPATPEEMAASAWATMNTGATGIVWGDYLFTGPAFGMYGYPMGYKAYTDKDRFEYGQLRTTNQLSYGDTDPRYVVDSMWLGVPSRFVAMAEVMTELRHIDTVVGWKNLLFNQEEMSVRDTRQTFAEIPMLDTLYTEQAKRYVLSYDTTASNHVVAWSFTPSDTFDTRAKTYMEVTHFRPGPDDSLGFATDARYLLLTNWRSWPIDTLTYSQKAVNRFTAMAAYTPFTAKGLGAIDVRRPIVKIKNSTGTFADSVRIEKVSALAPWDTTVAFDQAVALDWHLPGRGALYRLTPISLGVSKYGTAYNNAVHSENTSTEDVTRDRVVVYERDSTVWLRTYNAADGWSEPRLISAANDTVYSALYSNRTAHNMHPAIATVRSPNAADSAMLIVWERWTNTRSVQVQALAIPGPPTVANIVAGSRFSLGASRTLPRWWEMMTPAVTGLDSGWVVAWGSPRNGIEVAAVRRPAAGPLDISAVATVKATWITEDTGRTQIAYSDYVAMFPTLAYVRQRMMIPPMSGLPIPKENQIVHLAWQQGEDTNTSNAALGPYIFYRAIGVTFYNTGQPQLNLFGGVEHVSSGLSGCEFRHPSIAADSSRIGVAFESRPHLVDLTTTPRQFRRNDAIVLRFRDSLGTAFLPPGAGQTWDMPAYYWSVLDRKYEYPSLTEFPRMAKGSLLTTPQGALCWHDATNFATKSPQWLYRYGDEYPTHLPDGAFPTMTLAPFKTFEPIRATGVFHRGDASTATVRARPVLGGLASYYPPSYLSEPTMGRPMYEKTFTFTPPTTSIYSQFSLGKWSPLGDGNGDCTFEGVSIGWVDSAKKSKTGAFPPVIGILPPSPRFFEPPGSGKTKIGTLADAAEVSRTGVFRSYGDTLRFKRVVAKSSNVVAWLNTFPYDNTLHRPADVLVLTELVKRSDSSVLWRSDTFSVRAMTQAVAVDVVKIPIGYVTLSNTEVFVRVRAVTTAGMSYKLNAGFQFIEGTVTAGSPKQALPEWEPIPEQPTNGRKEEPDLTARPHAQPR